jgi:hypothetical protein
VDRAEVRKTKAGKDYLAVRIGDKTVSFFEAADVVTFLNCHRDTNARHHKMIDDD